MHLHAPGWLGGLTLLAACALAQPVQATDAVVGPGQCTESGFAAVLAAVDGSGGGTITFNCGTATFVFTGYKSIAGAVTVDGGGRITFDGHDESAFFQVYASANVVLRRIALTRGASRDINQLENFGTLTLDRVAIGNSWGTAVLNYGTLTVKSSEFIGNRNKIAGGGAIRHEGSSLSVVGSTFMANGATNGGAIYSSGAFTVTNSTFAGNAAGGGGGAIFHNGAAPASVVYATILDNQAVYGAGLYSDSGGGSALTVGKSILRTNTGGNCDGVIASSGYNLSNDSGCGGAFTGPGDLINQSLPMQPDGYYGGPTYNIPPAVGNPAIDHVPRAECAALDDQRGAVRPAGAGCDSGAVELNGAFDRVFASGFDVL